MQKLKRFWSETFWVEFALMFGLILLAFVDVKSLTIWILGLGIYFSCFSFWLYQTWRGKREIQQIIWLLIVYPPYLLIIAYKSARWENILIYLIGGIATVLFVFKLILEKRKTSNIHN